MIDRYAEELGLDPQAETEAAERRRIIGLKRRFPEGVLQPLRARQSPVQGLPFDIWYTVGQYLEALSALKLEKSCMGLYLMFNRQCEECDAK